jgi:hypothetical protein
MSEVGDTFVTDEGVVMVLVERECDGFDRILSETWEPFVNVFVRRRLFSDFREPETIYPYTWADALIWAGWTPPWGGELQDRELRIVHPEE